MAVHELKCWPQFFDAIEKRAKRFEVRKDDRDPGYAEHDLLALQKFDPEAQRYVGRDNEFCDKGDAQMVFRRISFVLRGGAFGVEPGYCVMSLEG